MKRDLATEEFFSSYGEDVLARALTIRGLLSKSLPDVIEQLDRPAKMVAYCYGQRYIDLVCTLVPSKKGLKLGFYKGNELSDPDKLLEGSGKISRYVEIHSKNDARSDALKALIQQAYEAYLDRTK
ncbi:DUF1801 domain-containing protein [Chryseolinea sp. T2]|uniref:DUF1801 domain-containing protein n=1 Tax=Chryseolinea sp. T2 TaxID=3129255 RepID=UPI003076D3BA